MAILALFLYFLDEYVSYTSILSENLYVFSREDIDVTIVWVNTLPKLVFAHRHHPQYLSRIR